MSTDFWIGLLVGLALVPVLRLWAQLIAASRVPHVGAWESRERRYMNTKRWQYEREH